MKLKRSVKAVIGLTAMVLLLMLSNLTALATNPTWVTKASMSTVRRHLQTAVIDGKIYAMGGMNSSGTYLSSAEKYDPATDAWTTITSMSTPRFRFQTEIVNGKIYVFGGNAGSSFLTSAEVYDPSTNTWALIASMSSARSSLQTEVIDGKIYALGGNNSYTNTGSSVEVYNPLTNTWTQLAPMSTARADFESVVLNGKIYVFGGYSISSGTYNSLSSAEVYDPATNTWTTLPSMSNARGIFQSEIIAGKIYAIGGANFVSNTLYRVSSVEMYDVQTNTWTTLSPMSLGRYYLNTENINGKIYVIGGSTENGADFTKAEMYDPSSNTWTAINSMSVSKVEGDTEVINGTIYAIGGNDTTGSVIAYTPVAPPAAPTLTATSGDTQVTLNWNSVTDAASYNVYRATTSGGPYTQIATGLTGTTYTDTGLTNGTTYYFAVTAANDAGESAYSNEVTATPEAAWNGLLRITMTTGAHKEYILTASQINAFIAWYNGNTSGSGSYMFNKTYNVGTLTSRKEYVAFSKIAYFEVMAYEEGSTPTPPTGTNTALLKVTMSTGDIMEYEMTSAQLIAFTNWYDSGASGNPTFAVSKAYNIGPFISRTDYLVFDKIVDYEILEY